MAPPPATTPRWGPEEDISPGAWHLRPVGRRAGNAAAARAAAIPLREATVPVRILSVVNQYWPYRGGAPNYVKELSDRFVRDGHRVTVFTTNAWDLEYLFRPDRKHFEPRRYEVAGVEVRRYAVRHPSPRGLVRRALGRIPSNPARFCVRSPSAILPGMWRDLLLRAGRYDVVTAAPSPFYSLIYPAYLAARLRRRPFVMIPFAHTGTPRGDVQTEMHTRPRQIELMRLSALVIVQSPAERDLLAARGVDPARLAVVGAGVNPEDLRGGNGARFRERHDVSAGERIIAYIGLLVYDKGAFHAFDAVAGLRRRGHRVRLAMIGHPAVEFTNYYSAQPAAARESCIPLGSADDAEKADLLDACDALVLPSRADSYGIVFLEAWLARRPVVGAYAGGIPHVVADGEDGFLVPFGDSHMLGECLLKLLGDPALARRMGERGRAKTLAECTWEMRYAKVRGLFEGLGPGGRR